MLRGEVAVSEGYEPPGHGKGHPRTEEVHREYQQRPAPLRVHERREYVLQVSSTTFGNVSLNDVAVAVLENHPLPDSPRVETGLTVSGTKEGNNLM